MNTSTLFVRLMNPDEVVQVAALARIDDSSYYGGVTTPLKTMDWSVAQANGHLLDDDSWIVVAMLEGVMIGFALVGWDSNPNQGFAYVARLFVHPDQRRKGYGTQVLNWIEQYARQKNKTTIRVLIRGSNQPSGNFYVNGSFVPVRQIPKYYPDTGEAGWVFERQVSEMSS